MSIKSSIYKEANAFRVSQDNLGSKDEALSGDIVISCSPATTTRAATAVAFSRDVEVSLKTATGEVHTWFNGTLPVAIADTSSAGTAAIADSATVVTLVNGVGTIAITGSAAAWLATETNTLTVSKNTMIPVLANVANATSVETIV